MRANQMKVDKNYIWEKLTTTVTSMAVSDYPLRKRLISIWFDQLNRLQSNDFEGDLLDLRLDFIKLEEVLNNPNYEAILQKMTDDEVYMFARIITHLYDQVCARHR